MNNILLYVYTYFISYIVVLAEEIRGGRSSAEAEARLTASSEAYLWLHTWLMDMWQCYT